MVLIVDRVRHVISYFSKCSVPMIGDRGGHVWDRIRDIYLLFMVCSVPISILMGFVLYGCI